MEYQEQNDRALNEIQDRVEQLQGRLKDRLEETHKLDDLSKKVATTSRHPPRSTQKLETTSKETRWMLMIKLYKWYIIIGTIVGLMIMMVINTFRR